MRLASRGPHLSHRAPKLAQISGSRSSWRQPAVHQRALPMRARRSPPASTSSWSTSKPMCWPGRCLQGRLVSERDGRPVFRDLRWSVYVVLKAPNDYARACFTQYGLKTDPSGWYAAMYKPYHLIGLELGMSVLSAALRGEPTGQAEGWRGDVVAIAKRALHSGETLDGEGG